MSEASRAGTEALPWWKTSVFYQVHPRSFLDTDTDGVGDYCDVDALFGTLDDFDRLTAGTAVWIRPSAR